MTEAVSITTDPLEPGADLAGRYRIVKLIGNGGMASVYLARDALHDEAPVALKVLHREFGQDRKYVERFIREVKLMHQVEHVNVVKTFDFGRDESNIYFTMEYIEGQSLDELMEERELTPSEIADLTVEIARGLQAIHKLQILHRDLKPANVLINTLGQVKIVDFGVAREEGSRLTHKNQKVGSVYYIAPEVWLGRPPTAAVDLYSLGVVLYELATGVLPFDESFPGRIMQMHLDEDPIPPRERNPECPVWLEDIILRLLEKSPKKRPRSADEVAEYMMPYTSQYAASTSGPSRIQAAVSSSMLRTANQVSGSRRGKTYILQLRATRLINTEERKEGNGTPRKTTVSIPLPHRAAVLFEIEHPSRDVIFLGLFLASLQIFDGVLTSRGIARWGTRAEANPFLRWLMHELGPENSILVVKGIAVLVVLILTMLARRMYWMKDVIAILSCLYLFAAILPWLFLFMNASLPAWLRMY